MPKCQPPGCWKWDAVQERDIHETRSSQEGVGQTRYGNNEHWVLSGLWLSKYYSVRYKAHRKEWDRQVMGTKTLSTMRALIKYILQEQGIQSIEYSQDFDYKDNYTVIYKALRNEWVSQGTGNI